MKLVLYSGGTDRENLKVDKAFIKLINKKNPVITFIPSSSYLAEEEFRAFVTHYSKFKVSRFIHFPVDIPFDQTIFKEVLRSDVIHLAGGNTFYFLHSLRKAKVIPHLVSFVKRGGILTGLSAGAIMMTNDIRMAGYPEFDRDENVVKLKNLKSLGLLNFHFFPHYRDNPKYEKAFKLWSRKYKEVILAVPDGAGIVVEDEKVSNVGPCFLFDHGHVQVLKRDSDLDW